VSDTPESEESDWGKELPLDDALDGQKAKAGRPNRIEALLREVVDEVELWRGSDGRGYATIDMDDHHEHHRVVGETFANWLRLQSQLRGLGPLGNSDVERLTANLNARCLGLGETHEVCQRVGRHGGKLYVDLADDKWRAVEIVAAKAETTERWRVVERPPVRFIRSTGIAAMPSPAPGGLIDDLRRWLNVKTEAHFRLTIAWLLSCYRARGPFPILVVSNSQGTGKSTLTKLLTRLVDPQQADPRSPPKSERDLWIACQHARLLAFDNLSVVTASMGDALCRIATGGAFFARTLYSNDGETILRACNPILLNSISDIIDRADLMDRAVLIETKAFGEGERRTEDDLWSDFEAEEPLLLGAIFDAVSAALGSYDETVTPTNLRMADAARNAAAACPFLNWSAEELLSWWRKNRIESDLSVIEADAVAEVLLEHLEQAGDRWEGSTKQLYDKLTELIPDTLRRSKDWPSSSLKFRSHITLLQPALASAGWLFEAKKGPRGKRSLVFSRRSASPAAPGGRT
jgi:hypothetical protein